MNMIAKILVALNALIHTYIAWFEIFAWETRGPNIFSSLPAELFAQTNAMAANQGLYNAFLVAGLIWSFFITDHKWQRNVATCFLVFIAVAGIFGALTVDTKTIYVQLIPSLLALGAIWMFKKADS